MSSNAFTLSQLTMMVGNAIRTCRETQNVWVQAEMSDLHVKGGHCYLELVEKDAMGNNRAKLRAMIWSSALPLLRRKFYETTGRDIASGMKVLVYGSVTHHSIYGLSFTIADIDPSYTLGDMERIRREILERLAREGLLGMNKSLSMPLAPQRIAVISAEGAAGYGDFMNQIEHNPEGFKVYTMLFHSVMQGEKTVPTVMEAFEKIEMTARMWDAVIIIRGGGSTTDLNGFDNYELARRVATFPLPVIVGIGHERDRTVLDEIACVRCKTPTAVAAFIIDSLRNAYALAADRVSRIAAYGSDAMRGEQMRLSNISQSLPALARNILMRAQLNLERLSNNLPSLVKRRVMQQNMLLSGYAGRIGTGVSAAVSRERNRMQQAALRLRSAASSTIDKENLRLRRSEDVLRLLSPENTLKRGYSITRIDGKAVRDVSEIPEDAIVETTLFNGTLVSKTLRKQTTDKK